MYDAPDMLDGSARSERYCATISDGRGNYRLLVADDLRYIENWFREQLREEYPSRPRSVIDLDTSEQLPIIGDIAIQP